MVLHIPVEISGRIYYGIASLPALLDYLCGGIDSFVKKCYIHKKYSHIRCPNITVVSIILFIDKFW